MSDRTSLGDRMKDYESVPRLRLMGRTPVIIRVDGRAFHTLTKDMKKPYDASFQHCMLDTALFLCCEIAGARLAYIQSDEISILVTDGMSRVFQPWFSSDLQKTVSVSAAIATAQFYNSFVREFGRADVRPTFDSRAWNIPDHEVANYFIWRQQDATRNSIQSLGRSYFTQTQLNGLSCDQIQAKLLIEANINWNDCKVIDKRGACVVRPDRMIHSVQGGSAIKKVWDIDTAIPIFSQNRDYISSKMGGHCGD